MRGEQEIREKLNSIIEILEKAMYDGYTIDDIKTGHLFYQYEVLCWALNEPLMECFLN